jgi:hypothetical protein
MKKPTKISSQSPALSAKDKFRDVYAKVQNVEMAGRISQMMAQRLLENGQKMDQDIGKLFQIVTELQYKFLALQQLSNVDLKTVNDKVADLRLKDFNEASDAEDKKEELLVSEMVQEDSTVILTSIIPGSENDGIFRSRIKLADSGVPALIEGLMGQTVGHKVLVTLNNQEHEIELLGIRNPVKKLEIVEN